MTTQTSQSTQSSEATQSPNQATAMTITGASLLVLALLVFIPLQYSAPPFSVPGHFGVSPLSVVHFKKVLGMPVSAPMDADRFALYFKVLLVTMYVGYAIAMIGLLNGGKLRARPMIVLMGGIAILFAVFCPPLLSSDTYAYIAHARIAALYGQNPYTQPPLVFLQAHHDPVADHLHWNFPAVYGPIWIFLSIGIVALLHGAGLWWQVVAVKLVEAAALIAAALSGYTIAERFSPGRGIVTLFAIGLNPLFIIEAVGNGHNDFLLVSLLLVAAMFHLKNRPLLTGLFLGLSVGIKLITLIALPWIIWEFCRGKKWPEKLKLTAAITAVTLLPSVLGYLPYWKGAATFTGMQQRTAWMLGSAGMAHEAYLSHWLARHGVWQMAIPLLLMLHTHWLDLTTFAALSLWMILRPRQGNWITAWGITAIVLMFFTIGIPFPWYICWFWPVFLTRWDRRHLGLSAVCFGLALVWESIYAGAFSSTPPSG